MAQFSNYKDKFKYVRFRREDGILEMAFHQDGGECRWTVTDGSLHEELPDVLYEVGRDRDNQIVIFTGTGDSWLRDIDFSGYDENFRVTAQYLDKIYKEAKDIARNLLDIEVPVIGAVNGDAFIHSELILLSDIVLCADHASFADKAHMPNNAVPADGVHVVYPLLLGPNRARYYLLTGKEIDAQEALRLGMVAEVLPKDKLMPRAWELARQLLTKAPMTLRYARVALTLELKRRMLNDLGYGMSLEGMAGLSLPQNMSK
jgi:enoyl-CoA hydratase/carnithine racemase